MDDLVIRNARVVDGAGGASFSADVAVREAGPAQVRSEAATSGHVPDGGAKSSVKTTSVATTQPSSQWRRRGG